MTIWTKVIPGFAALTLMLSGCARVENENSWLDQAPQLHEDTSSSMTCTSADTTMEFQATGDALDSSRQTIFFTYEQLGLDPSQYDADDLKVKAQEAFNSLYSTIDGVTCTCEVQDGGVQAYIDIDYSKANLEQLSAYGLIQSAEIQNRFVSMEKTQQALESSGYACTMGD